MSHAGGGSTWTYTITKSSDDAKDLGHFILSFDTCGDRSPTIASILSATVNGVNWLDQIEPTEGVTGCGVQSANFVKFDDLPAADTYVIEFTLDDIYPLMDSTAWLKSGKVCLMKALPGPGCRGYLRTSAMEADPSMVGKKYFDINSYMRTFGFDYTEHPNCTGGYGGHIDGVHGDVESDPFFDKHVFRFDIHIDPVIDGDRCSSSTYTQRPLHPAPDLVDTQIDAKVRKFPALPSTHWLFDGRTQCPVCQQVFTPGDEVAMWIMARPEQRKTKEAAVVHWLCVPEDARDDRSVRLTKEMGSP